MDNHQPPIPTPENEPPLQLANFPFNQIQLGPGLPNEETLRRGQEEKDFQENVHSKVFQLVDLKDSDELNQRNMVFNNLEKEGRTITILYGGEGQPYSLPIPLHKLARLSPLVLTMGTNSNFNTSVLSLDFREYEESCVGVLIRYIYEPDVTGLVFLPDEEDDEDGGNGSHIDEDDSIMGAKNYMTGSVPITPTNIIDLLRISHYLQLTSLYDKLIEKITNPNEKSIDKFNCLSLFLLSTQILSNKLYECCLTQIFGELQSIKTTEEWKLLPIDMQHKILTFKNAVTSNMISTGTKTNVFFADCSEFLAIFRESITIQNERLEEAEKVQLEHINRQQLEFENIGEFRRRFKRFELSEGVIDAQRKIDKQRRRVETLKSYYKEQQGIFSGNKRIEKKQKNEQGGVSFFGNV